MNGQEGRIQRAEEAREKACSQRLPQPCICYSFSLEHFCELSPTPPSFLCFAYSKKPMESPKTGGPPVCCHITLVDFLHPKHFSHWVNCQFIYLYFPLDYKLWEVEIRYVLFIIVSLVANTTCDTYQELNKYLLNKETEMGKKKNMQRNGEEAGQLE